ncbi:MAG: tetratricopeptide repeat protein [Mucilaginibacter sp.]|nr:tetratricopeptide repeat protein [Mucilaginibacter sp.]
MKKILLLLLLLTGIKYTYAQSAHLKFDHFTVKDGLPERQIQFIQQDDQGYMWIGTQNGLVRYDGYKPKVYRFGVAKNDIYQNCSAESMLIDKDKNIWICTVGNGLFRYNRKTDSFIQYPYPQKPGKRESFKALLAESDQDGNLWAFNEYLRLSYHGFRAKEKSFNAATVTNLDSALPKVNVIPQDIGRVLLNLFNNAFYAVHLKQQTAGSDYKPEVSVTTSSANGQVIIRVKDNGNGIPDEIKDKIMQPFFTTKPTGEGTGLGVSLTYDMVVKGHGGNINVETKEGEYTEFTIALPLT